MTGRAPDADILARASRILGWQPTQWSAVSGGYTPAARYRAGDGTRSVFVKHATTPLTARMLHNEIKVYDQLSAPFMPRLYGVDDDPDRPMLIIEDLSGATWPPPWTDDRLDAVLETIGVMHATPSTLEKGGLLHGRDAGWPVVAADPEPFLSLGMISATWLERALPHLIAAEAACTLEGDALTHLDLRSDNLCLTTDGVKIIDWAEACRSDAQVDLGFFLPSLAFEGGPLPDTILPDAPAVAATVSGFFAARAGLPDIADAPYVRRVQRQQLATALPWVVRALDLQAP
ncbi:MAG: aminoglycoside phosphotransferase family protein [Devosia sp.]|uniref:aminoglycoside phosphotransferase family protein n=1 Tax=Devosia sp. TaxID=1871048 RepID=UPI0024CA2CE6|nr:aminoglycoside phosphotransferase family protein [Devosia sp.]UYO00957.1 MAG: aminoglycoside phosphotransferase family protein [Devosia sp.]